MLHDVTDTVDRAGAKNRRAHEREEQERREAGLAALARAVTERASAGKPLVKSEAEQILCGHGFTRQAARVAIAEESAWRLEAHADRRGHPVALLPRNDPDRAGGENEGRAEEPYLPGICESPFSAAQAGQARRELADTKPLYDKEFLSTHLPAADETVTLGSDRQAAAGDDGAAAVSA